MVHKQYLLPIASAAAYSGEDFFVTPANVDAHTWIMRWPDWPSNATILLGAPSSGKTHLTRIWKAHSKGEVIENFDTQLPVQLFHLLNRTREQNTPLLLTSARAPSAWPFTLPDLLSRLKALPHIHLQAPDDALLSALLTKHFADRQLRVGPEIIAYIVPRIERSCAAAASIVDILDQAALAEHKRLTLPLVRKYLP